MSGAAELLARLDAVEDRLRRHADLDPSAGLTEPDPPTGERWDWGQVWAHVAEFPAYWIREVRKVLGSPASGDPPPFGRVKSDPVRVGAIERDRFTPPAELMARVQADLEDLRRLMTEMTPEDWAREVSHSTLGVFDMRRVFADFLVGHLEAHARQLDGLVEGAKR